MVLLTINPVIEKLGLVIDLYRASDPVSVANRRATICPPPVGIAAGQKGDATSGLRYAFNDENQLTGAAGFNYVYDGDGERVEKTNKNPRKIIKKMDLFIFH